jgi:hypothetical protein
MARTAKQTKTPATTGFAIEIKDDTALDGLLMYEYASGGYRPVAAVSTPNEAQEIAASYKPEVAGIFRLWARGIEGEYIPVSLPIRA